MNGHRPPTHVVTARLCCQACQWEETWTVPLPMRDDIYRQRLKGFYHCGQCGEPANLRAEHSVLV